MAATQETLVSNLFVQIKREEDAILRLSEQTLNQQRSAPIQIVRALLDEDEEPYIKLADRDLDGLGVPTTFRLRRGIFGRFDMGLHLEGITDVYQYIGEVHPPSYSTARLPNGVLVAHDDGLHFTSDKGRPEPMNDVQRALAISVLTEAAEIRGINLG